ncbi:MAG: redox-sensing transcriptional repressor Rex [Deltaproteobacteria bacterium HGW-Deltaproteobacteria-22]|nr:MAG: redox-sensing transcriptional repressor Rex [Deltaproteobacteria bacterium HGW-Deltaproteobacteria-22]
MERMPRYLMQLYRFKTAGIDQVSSQMLGDSLRIKDTQIRKDLSYFGVFGKARYGYNIDFLIDAVEKILGLNNQYRVAIVGFGRIGRALAHYHGSDCHNFCVQLIFDTDPAVIGEVVGAVPVESMDLLEARLAEQTVDIAVLTVPEEVADRLAMAGVKSIYNFTAAELHRYRDVFIENAQIAYGMYKLAHRIAGHWPRKR